jgi:signal peptidase I
MTVARYGFLAGRFLAAATLAGLALIVAAVLLLLVACAASQGAYSVNPILSQSMRPTFSAGDAVVLQRIPVSELRPGMVVAIKTPSGEIRIHRVVSFDATTSLLVTRGDANQASDTPLILKGAEIDRLVDVVPFLAFVWSARALEWLISGGAIFVVFAWALIREVRSQRTLRHAKSRK